MNNYKDITIALAAIYQSVSQVIRLAKTGQCDDISMEPLVMSVLKIDADNCEQVYGSISNLKPGLQLLKESLQVGASGKSVDLGRYIATILTLERKLSGSDAILNEISNRIRSINFKKSSSWSPNPKVSNQDDSNNEDSRLSEEQPVFDTSIIRDLALLYKDTISTLSIRLHINGEEKFLTRSEVQDKVRCYLFCAVRSAVLWRQMGGQRRQLLFKRKTLVRVASNLLESRYI